MANILPNPNYDNLPIIGDPSDGVWKEGFLTATSQRFDAGVIDLKKELEDAELALGGTAGSNPTALAKYQAALGEYTLYRSAQSKAVEALASMDKATVNRLA